MKKILILVLAAVALVATACTQPKKSMNTAETTSQHKVLVAYFSATGTTAAVAQRLAKAAGADLYSITPAAGYTAADLDWNDKQSRSSVEMADEKSRPALGGDSINTDAYDVIYVGFPIWWDLAPRVVNTFLDAHNLKGKTIIPFATSGGSTIANSARVLKQTYPQATWREGRLLNGASDKELSDLVAGE